MDPADMDKLAAQYAPILKFARGESFFPMDVQDYIAKCSLHIWEEPDGHRMLKPPGSLTLDEMIQWPHNEYFLVYAEEEYTTPEAELVSGQAAGKVGVVIRKLISRVTEGALPKPCQRAKTLYGQDELKPVFYYRILDKRQRGGNLDIIQYFFFYAFNDWATSHDGINDHEADWERVSVFFHDFNDARPVGVAYSAHKEHFWKSWEKVLDAEEQRPVVYVDGGSHANLPSKRTSATSQAGGSLLKVLWEFFRRGMDITWDPGEVVIGFSKTHKWQEPTLKALPDVDPVVEKNWVNGFRGLWGARYYWRTPNYIRFIFMLLNMVKGTERPGRAPGGPMYGHDGEVRADWRNPEALFEG